jgi:hypothetical protein
MHGLISNGLGKSKIAPEVHQLVRVCYLGLRTPNYEVISGRPHHGRYNIPYHSIHVVESLRDLLHLFHAITPSPSIL